jgi:hypothetical protein
MLVTPISLQKMAEALGLTDLTAYARPDGTFTWILLKAGSAGGQTTLILGDVRNHADLFMMSRIVQEKPANPKQLWAMMRAKNAELRDQYGPDVLASGAIDRKGTPESWESKWLVKKTPEGMQEFLRDELVSAIRMYFPERLRAKTHV